MNHSATASLVDNYAKNFDRSSEAVCRTALDFILNEFECDCAGEFNELLVCDIGDEPSTSQKGNHVDRAAEKTSDWCDRQQKTPTPCDDIRIYGEVTFNHEVHPQSRSKTQPTSASRVTVTDRLDYGSGRVIDANSAETQRRCASNPSW
jgi:hypothetical protein